MKKRQQASKKQRKHAKQAAYAFRKRSDKHTAQPKGVVDRPQYRRNKHQRKAGKRIRFSKNFGLTFREWNKLVASAYGHTREQRIIWWKLGLVESEVRAIVNGEF